VESLLGDIRISQHADMNYASAIMKNGKWMFLDMLDGGRAGFLVMMPKSPIIWMDDKGKNSYIIPMRVQSHLSEKGTICIASLNKTEGILRIEDMKIVEGEDIRGLSFTKRWTRLLDIYKHSYVYDATLQRDLRIQPAVYKPIESIEGWGTPPDFIFAQNDTMPRRLRIQLRETQPGLDLSKNLLAETGPTDVKPPVPPPPPPRPPISNRSNMNTGYTATAKTTHINKTRTNTQPVSTQRVHTQPVSTQRVHTQPVSTQPVTRQPVTRQPVTRQPVNTQPVNTQPVTRQPVTRQPVNTQRVHTQNVMKPQVKETRTLAIPSEEFPDTYTIVINGETKGYAAVQDINISRLLRNKTNDTKEIPVKVEWNDEFSSYEIISLV